jgi:hypothetical protein
MINTFGDLKTGIDLYYIAWDEEIKAYNIFQHNVIVHEPNNINFIQNTITISIKIRPGELLSHGINDLVLSKNKSVVKWGDPHWAGSKISGGLAITVDYDEAKKICLSFMRQYCELMRERTKSMVSEMYEAITKFHDMVENYVG